MHDKLSDAPDDPVPLFRVAILIKSYGFSNHCLCQTLTVEKTLSAQQEMRQTVSKDGLYPD